MTMILIISTFKSIVCEVLYETLRFDISIISLGSRNRIIVRLVARCDLRNCAKKDRKNFDKISSNFDIDSSNRSEVSKSLQWLLQQADGLVELLPQIVILQFSLHPFII